MEKIDDTEISKLPHITLIASDVKAQSSGKYVKQRYVQGAGLSFSFDLTSLFTSTNRKDLTITHL